MLLSICLVLSCGVHYVDNRPEPITHINSDVSPRFVYYYYDSVPQVKWNQPKVEWVSEVALATNKDVKQIVYYFPPPQEEMYKVGFTWPIVIMKVYNDSAKTWLMKNQLSQSEITRIAYRFETEVLQPMVDFGKSKNYPDSLIFVK